MDYDYPGNVRELRNIMERAAILAATDPIHPDHLVFDSANGMDKGAEAAGVAPAGGQRWLNRRGARLDRGEIVAVLERFKGHRGQAAQALGVSERTLYRYLQRLRVPEDAY